MWYVARVTDYDELVVVRAPNTDTAELLISYHFDNAEIIMHSETRPVFHAQPDPRPPLDR